MLGFAALKPLRAHWWARSALPTLRTSRIAPTCPNPVGASRAKRCAPGFKTPICLSPEPLARDEFGGAWGVPFCTGFRAAPGRLFFGYFLLAKQKKVPRAPGGTGYFNQYPRSGFKIKRGKRWASLRSTQPTCCPFSMERCQEKRASLAACPCLCPARPTCHSVAERPVTGASALLLTAGWPQSFPCCYPLTATAAGRRWRSGCTRRAGSARLPSGCPARSSGPCRRTALRRAA
ncbi:hypothetical protein PSELUDRAFT_1082 [Vogesella sp. LIG4]|nr:hypothetical protein PSELUDRAFT_1082 [Vogesella sp. LIG4]